MRFVGGIPLNVVLTTVMAVALGPSSIMLDSAETIKKTKPFNVWFRAEPNPPRKKDMKPVKLNRLIGSDYNEMWMSKTEIITGDGNATDTLNDRSKATGPDELQFPDQLPAQYQEMMRTWLVHRGSCSVEYVWSDLGKSFWPRWIKKGRCGRTDTMSCSWPPGMSCVPSSIRVLNLLRWHCWLKNRKNKRKKEERKMIQTTAKKTRDLHVEENGRAGIRRKKKKPDKFRCLWIKVPYPVTEDCTCSCRKIEE